MPTPPCPRRPRSRGRSLVGTLAAALAVVVALGPGTALAQTAPTTSGEAPAAGPPLQWAVEPSGPYGTGYRDAFSYTLAPGQVVDDVVGVSNLSSEPLSFQVYATDARNTAAGGFTLLPGNEDPTDIGTWIDLAVGEYVVEPGQRADIPFRLTVPDDASPGDHAGGIVAARFVAGGTTADGGVQVDSDQRVGARVYLRVEGDARPGLAVEGVDVGYSAPATPFGSGRTMTVRFQVRNTGNVMLAPDVNIALEGPFGRGNRGPFEHEVPELLPGSTYEIVQELADVQPLGRFELRIGARADGDEPVAVERTMSVWAVPWATVAVVAALVALAVARAWSRHRRRRAARRQDDFDWEAATADRPGEPVRS
ncbi:MAG: DUF916 domain-containing protein [Acidimicrobiia bacterium]